jgi:16S rRNA (cytosine1402-N4)-methyltransferase
MISEHQPVMLAEVLEALGPRAGGHYVDGTLGGGGHARAILDTSAPDGRLLGLDADETVIERARRILERYGDRVTLLHASFQELGSVAPAHGFASCDGVLLDLGLSSDQVADPDRGFSFQTQGPLDMRFDRSRGQTAADLLNQASERQLAEIFYRYGEERRSRRLARAVVERRRARPFVRTDDLLAVVEVSLGNRRWRLHPATRAFQALRIAVNDELAALEKGLEGAAEVLTDGGRLAVISFHSLEDRIVKHFVRSRSADKTFPSLKAITRKPLTPRAEERRANPRSRSAKLRIAERLSTAA